VQERVPKSIQNFQRKYPQVYETFADMGKRCHEVGPLDEKTRRLVKLGIAIAFRHEGAVHSAARNALKSGAALEELHHVAILAITTIGWPAAFAAMTWIDDAAARRKNRPE
jgi:4-carboxymuconolactone decarboxylase